MGARRPLVRSGGKLVQLPSGDTLDPSVFSTKAFALFEYIATAGQTTFSGADRLGNTLAYTVGNVIVNISGSSQGLQDITASDGTSVVVSGGNALSAGDLVQILAISSFQIADSYSKSYIDTQDAKAYTKANILGTVSQSNGVPTGAIIERGSNANGSWVKFADGTMEVFGTIPDISLAANAVGNSLITFPIAFAAAPTYVAAIGVPSVSYDVYGWTCYNTLSTTGVRFGCKNGGNAQNLLYNIYTAKGRWF